jgi:uncharacterized protein (UPF0335 family)
LSTFLPNTHNGPCLWLAEVIRRPYRHWRALSRCEGIAAAFVRDTLVQWWGKDMTSLQASAQAQLRQLIEQLERLEEEKKALAGDIRDKFAEAKAMGFDPKIMKQILRIRKQPKDDRDEEEALLATYLHALGMLDTMPSEAAMMAAE